MTKKLITIDQNDSVFQASNLYKQYKVGCLLVIDNEKPIGILTERDIIERTICRNRDPKSTKVSEVMSKDLIFIHALKKLEDALDLMKKYNIKKLPVMSNDVIIGIVTVTDISRARPDLSKRFMDSWVKSSWND